MAMNLHELVENIRHHLESEGIGIASMRESGNEDDESFGIFLDLESLEDGEPIACAGPWADSDVLIQLAPNVGDREMMRVNSLLMQRVGKLAVAVIVGYPD
jgi:hypothetical protein